MIWSKHVVSRLVCLARERNSASEIADKLVIEFDLDISRNAVIGKLHRLGEPLPGPLPRADDMHPKPMPKPRLTAPKRASYRWKDPVFVPAAPNPTRLLDITEFQCRAFMPGQDAVIGPDKLYCGAPVGEGTQFRFCPACATRFVVPAPRRRDQITQRDRSMAMVA